MDSHFKTVGSVMQILFPRGTKENSRSFSHMPSSPTDVFGAAAFILERSGVYHLMEPPARVGGVGPTDGSRTLTIGESWRDECKSLGRQWEKGLSDAAGLIRQHPTGGQPPPESLSIARQQIEPIWNELESCHDQSLHPEQYELIPLPRWCELAFRLLIIADEASANLGYLISKLGFFEQIERMVSQPQTWHYSAVGRTTFAYYLDPKVARVLPKSRTPSVGCTLRTLSHNLALVPPEGIVDISWHREPFELIDDVAALNLLLVPLPYKISARAFKTTGQVATRGARGAQWGWFDLDQLWLRDPNIDNPTEEQLDESANLFADFIFTLLREAENDVGRIHGVILPELALDRRTYVKMIDRIKARYDDGNRSAERKPPVIDFLVSGISEDPRDSTVTARGNFAAVTTFSINPDRELRAATYARAKHHRWQLNSDQIATYGLSSRLDPNVNWWECITLPPRQIGLSVFRSGAIFAAMICEDLARIDPCHDPLRSVGPNIVFVLLMDGPQLPERWSARYSTTLADDPGSSVLTLTSLGLMERSNQMGRFRASRSIAIWKDDSGQTVQIDCPKGAHAVVVNLSGMATEEFTLDGRANDDTQAWRYRGHQPIAVPRRDLPKYAIFMPE